LAVILGGNYKIKEGGIFLEGKTNNLLTSTKAPDFRPKVLGGIPTGNFPRAI